MEGLKFDTIKSKKNERHRQEEKLRFEMYREELEKIVDIYLLL